MDEVVTAGHHLLGAPAWIARGAARSRTNDAREDVSLSTSYDFYQPNRRKPREFPMPVNTVLDRSWRFFRRVSCSLKSINPDAARRPSGQFETALYPGSCNVSPLESSTARANRLLVLDDDPFIPRWIRKVAEHEGYDVSICTDLTTIRAVHRSARPTLILMDLTLGGGYQGLEALRLLSAERSTTPIILTGAAEPGVLHSASRFGMTLDLSMAGIIRSQSNSVSCAALWPRTCTSSAKSRPST